MKETKKSCFNFFNLFDFYGINFPFRYRKKPRFATKLGILLSLITVIFSLMFSIIYLKELIDRHYFELFTFRNKSRTKIDFSNIPLMVGLLDSFGNPVKIDPNYVDIILDNNNHIIKKNGERSIERISKSIELDSCINYLDSLNSTLKNRYN